jgi:hypothetical protein
MQENITKEDLSLINSYAQSELTEDELFTFSLVLCTDSVDRDMERFSRSSLEKLAALFKGKTGIFDHDPKGEKQTARIFRCCVETAESGESRLKARAYMVRTASNADLIREIMGGIKKEVSVSCSCAVKTCSVCGTDLIKGACLHKKGMEYDGKTCVHILDEPTDAYEWSFVAVPAQKRAGVTKQAATQGAVVKTGTETDEDIRADILRMSYFCKPFISSEAISSMTSVMTTDQLKSFRLRLRSSMLSDEQRLYAEEKSIIPKDDDNRSYKL